MPRRKANPKRITEGMVLSGIKSKMQRMEEEMRRNPQNVQTGQRLAAFKELHKSKLKSREVTV